MKLNYSEKKIEITTAEAKKASRFGTDEYKALVEARKDYNDFEVIVIKSSAKRTEGMKGLTLAYMKDYIERNGSAEQAEQFNMLCNPSHDGLTEKRQPYAKIKKWFLESFPEILDYSKSVEAILSHKEIA